MTAYWDNTATDAQKTFTLEIAAAVQNNTAIKTADPDDLWIGVAIEFDGKTIWSAQKAMNVSTSDVGTSVSYAFLSHKFDKWVSTGWALGWMVDWISTVSKANLLFFWELVHMRFMH